MQRPIRNAPISAWVSWADEQFPFSGYKPFRSGFEVLRGIDDAQLRADVIWAIVQAMPVDPMDRIPLMDPRLSTPDPRLPAERDYDPDSSGIDNL